MRSSDIWAAAAGLVLLNAASWVVWMTDQSDGVLFALLAVATAVSAMLMALVAPRDQHALAASLVLVIPVIGPIIAAWAVTARGHGGADLLPLAVAPPAALDAVELGRRLTNALPPTEALVSRDLEVRRAAIARLAARASFEDINLLKWAHARRDPELSAEAALALAEIGERFVRQLRAARRSVAEQPEHATHVAVFDLVARAVIAGIVDSPLVAKLASEARFHHDKAVALAPDRARELLATRARLELVVRRPELVLALLERETGEAPAGELGKLYLEAAYAARVFGRIPPAEGRRSGAV